MPNKTKIQTVFLDMDGILTDFVGAIHNTFNEPYDYNNSVITWNFWEKWTQQVVKHENIVAKCDVNFWANLKWMHDGQSILKVVQEKFSLSQIYLLTNPVAGGVETATGKMQWLEKHLPEFLDRVIITQAPKALLAKPDTLLIDDHDENVDEFRAAGGEAIRVPRPWNCLHFWSDCALEIVELRLRSFTG